MRPLAGQRGPPRPTVAYMSAENSCTASSRALRFQSTMEFKDHLRSVDVLMIDDVQFLIGKDNTQEEFFHTFNALDGCRKSSGRSSPPTNRRSDLDRPGRTVAFAPGLGAWWPICIAATYRTTDFGILHAKADEAPACAVPDKVMEFLAHKITIQCARAGRRPEPRSPRMRKLVGRTISLEMTQEVLVDHAASAQRTPQ